MHRLEHKFHAEFGLSPSKRWKTAESGIVGGEIRSAGNGAGNVTMQGEPYLAGASRRSPLTILVQTYGAS